VGFGKIEDTLCGLRVGHYLLFRMTSAELGTWLLGIGGYAGLFGSIALVYLYPNFPRNFVPLLFVVPVVSAGGLYVFFQLLYIFLSFTIQVLQAMLNEEITVALISTTFIGGQATLTGYVIYNYALKKRIAADQEEEYEDTHEDEEEHEEEQDGEQEEEHEEHEEHEEEQQEEETDDRVDDDAQGADEDADDEDDAATPAAVVAATPPAPATPITPAFPTPFVPPMCVDCDNDCVACIPPLINLSSGLSGEILKVDDSKYSYLPFDIPNTD
jgi:hypothetical protein